MSKMSQCQYGADYIRKLIDRSLSDGINEALKAIQKHLYPDAKFQNGQPIVREISEEESIAEYRRRIKGVYRSKHKDMELVRGLWCIQTVFHESLHAVSAIQQLEEAILLKPLFEGLTECLTGYLLYKEHQYSYHNCWKAENTNFKCRIPDLYVPNCKRWGSFFHFLPVQVIIPLYFEPIYDWKKMCGKFVELIHNKGYTNFNDVLGDIITNRSITDLSLWRECEKVFKKKFKVYSWTYMGLDFSNLKS